MQCNVGKKDEKIRTIIGSIILGIAAYYHSWWAILGIILIITAITEFCALYPLLGINTAKKKKK